MRVSSTTMSNTDWLMNSCSVPVLLLMLPPQCVLLTTSDAVVHAASGLQACFTLRARRYSTWGFGLPAPVVGVLESTLLVLLADGGQTAVAGDSAISVLGLHQGCWATRRWWAHG